MHQSHMPQCTILYQKYAHTCTFLLQNGTLWDMGLVHRGICEIGLLDVTIKKDICHRGRYTSRRKLTRWLQMHWYSIRSRPSSTTITTSLCLIVKRNTCSSSFHVEAGIKSRHFANDVLKYPFCSLSSYGQWVSIRSGFDLVSCKWPRSLTHISATGRQWVR